MNPSSGKTTSITNPRTTNSVRALCEPRSSTPMLTTEELAPAATIKKKQKRFKRCHGNRKVQRFRKKCRAKGMKPGTIAKQVQKRFRTIGRPNEQVSANNNQLSTNISTTTVSNKRKSITVNQISRSMSTFSIVSSPPKKKVVKKKSITVETTTSASMLIGKNIYRRAPYLQRLSSSLLYGLSRQLNYKLKKKLEKSYVYKRLQLLDEQFCLEHHQSLWQNYLNLGL